MKCDKKDLLLYAVTDRSWLKGQSLYQQVEEAIKGGATMIQLREKELKEDQFFKEAVEIQKLCRRYQIPFLINDNVELAQKIQADGVHVGQSDMEALDVRKKLGDTAIIGVSARTVEEAVRAFSHGADYLGVGAVFPTGTKTDAEDVDKQTLKEICQAVDIPVVAIGGIGTDNILTLKGSGICGVAVVSAVFGAADIRSATEELLAKVKQIAE
ncbi:Thiamine-phosphate synthase [uncultured Roseburia sp.]|uniref:Thiamine-phosphate synthase n=1 Tax=Brotonthovivens ammoniilytica TaxID=2981725 RepID=A0ABT2TMI4_9FIRM|nr:thiamine phosphate synthase [Brotonthovivens ammoniilytica]MCU6763302.1 thiamine phosphate synthase [Brotonthovivens ammoniilytica]SCJ12578.1 Thiamine-phosphate synthase [uncultured Roseburia sp.]